MKITNENFFDLNDIHDDEAAENKSAEVEQTTADHNEVNENKSTVKQTAVDDEANENKSAVKQTAADDDEVTENKSAVKQTAADDDEVTENKSTVKQTAAERLRAKLLSLRRQDNGETDPDTSENEAKVADDYTSENEAKVADDDEVVDLQKDAPIVLPQDDDETPIEMDPSNDDVPQQPADITTRYVALPEELKENYQDNDGLPKVPTANDGDEPETDTADNADVDEPEVNDADIETKADDEPETDDLDEPEVEDVDNSNKSEAVDADDDEPEVDDLETDEADVDEPEVDEAATDESEASVDELKPDTERIQLTQPCDKNSGKSGSSKKFLAIVGCVAFALIATTTAVGVSHMHSTSSQPRTASSRTVASAKKKAASASSRSVDGSSLNAVKEKLTAAVKATGQPYKVQVTALGGGYTMGVVTYYPNDATKTYMDYSITAPETPGAVTDDKTAQDINKTLSSSLPTINKTITVIDKSKVSMSTYKQSDGSYHTILLYDNKPFGFVTTKQDGNMINNVTTYYIQHVQKKTK